MEAYFAYQPPTEAQALADMRFLQGKLKDYQRLGDQAGIAAVQSLLREVYEDLLSAREQAKAAGAVQTPYRRV